MILDAESSRRASMALSVYIVPNICMYICMPNIRLEYLELFVMKLAKRCAMGLAHARWNWHMRDGTGTCAMELAHAGAYT
jgi:hypothetical protein